MNEPSFVYIMSNMNRNVLYIGETSELEKRINQHKSHSFHGSFTDKYNCTALIYYEEFSSIEEAISREKQLKTWSRKKKDKLIKVMNPNLKDLADFPCN